MAKSIREIFDIVSTHLLTQKVQSMEITSYGESDSCAYRGVDGRRCAIGVLIPDELYNPSIEGSRVNALPIIKILHTAEVISDGDLAWAWYNPLGIPTPNRLSLLEELQDIHDGVRGRLEGEELVDTWKRRLDALELGLIKLEDGA